MVDLQNTHWKDWEIIKVLGRGSFGTVYKIQRQLPDGETEFAALKVIRIPQSPADIDSMHSEGYDDAAIAETFKEHLNGIINEYNMMQKLDGHTNIVNSKDISSVQHEDGMGWDVFIRMELLTPLMKALPEEVADEMVINLGIDICKALQLCNKLKIVHRDIKPQNIFVSESGDYKLGDFGVAKVVEKTVGGTKIGTYKYMAPEVYYSQPYGQSSDVYSLGLVLYWMLNERRMPFMPLPPTKITTSIEEESRRRRLSSEPLPPPANGSAALKQIVLKACAYHPKDRYASADELLADLNATATGTYVMKTDNTDIQRDEEGTTGSLWLANDEGTTGPTWKKKNDIIETYPVPWKRFFLKVGVALIVLAVVVVIAVLGSNSSKLVENTLQNVVSVASDATNNNAKSTETPLVSTDESEETNVLPNPIIQSTQSQITENVSLTVEQAEDILRKARAVIVKWLGGAGYSKTQTIKIDETTYGLVPYTKAEMEVEFNTYLHHYYYEDLFEDFYAERNGNIYYRIGGFGVEGHKSFITSELMQSDSGYTLTAHGISYDALGGTQYDEQLADDQFEFVLQDGNWVVKGVNGEFSEGSYWSFHSYHFISEKDLFFPEILIAPQEAFLDTFGNEDGMSVNMRSGPGTNNSIIKKIPDNAKLYVCGTSEAYPDWVFICYLGDFGWVIRSCVFSEDVLTEGNLLFRFKEANSLFYLWLDRGDVDSRSNITRTANGKTYTRVYRYKTDLHAEFAKYFSKELYQDRIDSLYKTFNDELYSIDDFDDTSYIRSEKATFKITSQTETECTFTVTVYPEDTSMSPITNTYKLKKVNGNWVFVEQFAFVNTSYNFVI